jgi:type IV fimbrial biogenesis protein FimT
MLNPRIKCYVRGVTLIELMVTITVLIVLLSIAIPSFQTAIASSSLTSATNDLVASIAQTRSTASRVGGRVTMCKSANSTQCTTSGDWEQGWIIFTDPSHTGTTANVDTGDTITYSYPATSNGIVIRGASGFDQYISYGADGQGKTNTGATLSGKIRVCSTSPAIEDSKRARDLVMNFAGRVVITKPVVSSTCPAP